MAGCALTAFSLGPTAPLAALRETGMVTALVISILFLKERATIGRVAGVLGILAGAALILGRLIDYFAQFASQSASACGLMLRASARAAVWPGIEQKTCRLQAD